MEYKRADLLPPALLKEIQKYVQGETIYIPIAAERKRRWGECSGERQRLADRDREICRLYKEEWPVKELSKRFYLSESGIRKILYRKE